MSMQTSVGPLRQSGFSTKTILAILLIFSTPEVHGGAPAQPEDSPAAEDLAQSDAFRLFSGSCAELAYLSDSQKRTLADPKNEENLSQFCFPEEPFECSDYNQLIANLGTLKTSEGGFHCSLVGVTGH